MLPPYDTHVHLFVYVVLFSLFRPFFMCSVPTTFCPPSSPSLSLFLFSFFFLPAPPKSHQTLRWRAFHKLLDQAGVGAFQWRLLLICGWANAADAVELMSLSFVVPSAAECDLGLTPNRKGWITSAGFLGMMFGRYLLFIIVIIIFY